MQVKKVLFPVDLAGSSYRIAPQVRSIADECGAELHLLYVEEKLLGYETFFIPHPSLDIMELDALKHAKREIEEFAEKYFEDRPNLKTVVLAGNPVEQILRYVEMAGIDLIVLALIDRHGLERAIFGDIAGEVVAKSPVPVTTVNPFIEAEKRPVQQPGEIHAIV